jgi:winged helix DNA-binding protein
VIKTVPQAARWIDKVGLALLFPKPDVVLPSLWEEVSGLPVTDWDDPAINFFWWAKDVLPDEGRAVVGKHLARVPSCIAPRLLPALVAANGEPLEDDPVVETIREAGPLTNPQLRNLTGLTRSQVDRALAAAHRRLVLTNAFLADEGSTWGSLAHDLLARKWKLPKRLPERDDARRELASTVLDSAGELTAADLKGVFGWRLKEAAAVLDEVAESREQDGFRIWVRP